MLISACAMAQPASPHFGDIFDLRNMERGVPDFLDHVRIDAVEHAYENGFAALNDNAEDRGCDQKADNGVGERIAEPHA
jgi:hypothetical protein